MVDPAGGSTRRRRPYQRRRRIPMIAFVVVLAVAAAVTWTTVLVRTSGPGGGTSCPAPAAGPEPGVPLESGALDAVVPAPPAAVPVRVLNAGGQRGQANLVAAQLGDLGFGAAGPPDNDPFFPDGDMECTGQVRFGQAGEAGASTLALVLPCVELVRDARPDNTVDVSVGTAFGDLNPIRAVRDALDQLSAPDGGSDGAGNADPGAAETAPETAATIDPAVLQAARDATC